MSLASRCIPAILVSFLLSGCGLGLFFDPKQTQQGASEVFHDSSFAEINLELLLDPNAKAIDNT